MKLTNPTSCRHSLILPALLIAASLGIVSVSPGAAKGPVAEVADGNTAFALDLYQRERTRPGNLFFSPYSISAALAMTYAGARGQTEQEMARVLHFGCPQSELPRAFAGLNKQLETVAGRKQVSLTIANSLWCQRDYHFTKAFLKLNRDFYHAETRQVDFVGNGAGACREINSWVSAKTRNKIPKLLQGNELTPLTRMVLCNAIYFKGSWLARFDAQATRPAPFFTAPGQTIEVPMMSQTLQLRSRAFDDCALCSLPYTGKELSMIILLPNANDGLDALERHLDAAKLREWLTALDKTPEAETELSLPKFKLDCRLELAKDLAAMGMPTAFSQGADFSGMTGKPDLFISCVVHRAFVDVNEEGTEAAAATGVVMTLKAVMHNPVFRVDHPFLFLIRENQSGSILFLGRVLDPTK